MIYALGLELVPGQLLLFTSQGCTAQSDMQCRRLKAGNTIRDLGKLGKNFHKLNAWMNVYLWMRSLYLWPNHDDKCQMWQTLEIDTTNSPTHTRTVRTTLSHCRQLQTFCKYFVKAKKIRNIYSSLSTLHT